MTMIDKLVYLLKQGVITLEQVAEAHRAAVASRLEPPAEGEVTAL